MTWRGILNPGSATQNEDWAQLPVFEYRSVIMDMVRKNQVTVRPTPYTLHPTPYTLQGVGCRVHRVSGAPEPLHSTGVPRLQETATPQDPPVASCLGSFGGPWGGGGFL